MSFQDIKGHDNIIHFFKKELGLNRIASSYLFFGPDGVGKTLLADTLAKALNCLEVKADSCDRCISCIKIENKNHPDIMRVDKNEKGSITIEMIRNLQQKINLKPYEARTKAFIIQDSHLMTSEAANCLLKTLEEPPKNSVIILITSKAEELFPTVRSRCRQIKFLPLELKVRIGLIQKSGLSKEDAIFLSRLANSGVSMSLDLENKQGLDIFGYRNKILEEFESKEALLDERSFIFSESKERMKFITLVLEAWFRDILILKSQGDESIVFNFDRSQDLKRLKDKFSFEELEQILKEIEDTQVCIDRNVGPKIAFNNLKMKMAGLRIKD